MPGDRPTSLTVEPIGHIRTSIQTKFSAGHQPPSESDAINFIDLVPHRNLELAVQDLSGFGRIWLIAWFDRNHHWRPRVLPPRGPAVRRGVLATRSPHRPNPVGLTSVPLLAVDGLTLTIGAVDLVDGTPILDIKPYIPTVDSWPDARTGWLEEVEASEQGEAPFRVILTDLVQEQVDWLREEWHVDFISRAAQLLSRDPSPHRTRRILQLQGGESRMACGGWRIYFQVVEDTVMIHRIGSGYNFEHLSSEGSERIIERGAHAAFLTRYPMPCP